MVDNYGLEKLIKLGKNQLNCKVGSKDGKEGKEGKEGKDDGTIASDSFDFRLTI